MPRSRGENHPGKQTAQPSRATAGRLSIYHRRLEKLREDGVSKISSGELGSATGVSEAQVRKDLASLGSFGRPGVGYRPADLISVIRRTLGLDREWPVVLMGVGNLARALLRYRGFREQGFRVVGVFDSDQKLIGQPLGSLTIESPKRLAKIVKAKEVRLGVITVPAEAAQEVADSLVAAGIRGILNFAPTVIKVPSGVNVVAVDLAVQLEQLAFLVQTNKDRTEPG